MIERHIHLSGATPVVLLYEIAKTAGYKLDVTHFFDFEQRLLLKGKVRNLKEYLDVIHIVDEAQSFPEAIRLSVYEAYKSAYLRGCRTMEIRWNPTKRSQGGKIDLDTLIVSARAGYERANMIFGIKGGMILCMGRDMPEIANEAVFKKVIQYKNKGIIGIDIAGMETSVKELLPYQHIYKTVHALDMLTTVHCGEVWYDGVDETIAYAIEKLGVSRIGHGIQIYRFPKLMKLAAKRGVHFELCLSSNFATGAITSKAEAKKILQAFRKYDLPYSVNTDASELLRTTLKKEEALHDDILAQGNSSS